MQVSCETFIKFMSTTTLNKKEINSDSPTYVFSRAIVPYPDKQNEKIKPPINFEAQDTTELFKTKDLFIGLSKEERREKMIQEHMDVYRKAERILIINYYTGGSAYKKGMLDAIYRGFNPLNP